MGSSIFFISRLYGVITQLSQAISYSPGPKFKFSWHIVRKCFSVLCNIVWGCGKRLDAKLTLSATYKTLSTLSITIPARGESNFELNNYSMVSLYEHRARNNSLSENNKFPFWDHCGSELFVNEKRSRSRSRSNTTTSGSFFDVNINSVYCFLILNKLCLKLFTGVLWMLRLKKRCWLKFRDTTLTLS